MKYRDLAPDQRRDAITRSKANVYKRRGKLAPEPCRLCRAPVAQIHHHDYTLPLNVDWLCAPCHQIWHMWMRRRSTVN